MKILLTAATGFEIEATYAQLKNSRTENVTDVLISGIGVASTMFYLTKKLLQTTYDLVIQAGIGGAFFNELHLGEVVLISADTFADSGIEERGSFTNLFAYGLADKDAFPYRDGWLVNDHIRRALSPAKTVKGITVNKITDNEMQIAQQRAMYNAAVESMEGAALHYVCLQLHIPFLQIRSISNRVGERDKSNWEMKKAIKNLNTELLNNLSTLSKNNA